MKIGDEGEEVYRQRLEAKLEPVRVRHTLAFAGLYGIAQEMIASAVLHEVREFFWRGFADGEHLYDELRYQEHVRSRAKNRFRASALWLVEMEAISLQQADRLTEIYAHRNDLSHELLKYVVDPDFEPDVDLLFDALAILVDIRRFWTGIEIDVGSFEEFGDVTVNDVVPMSLQALQVCIDAYVDGLTSAG